MTLTVPVHQQHKRPKLFFKEPITVDYTPPLNFVLKEIVNETNKAITDPGAVL